MRRTTKRIAWVGGSIAVAAVVLGFVVAQSFRRSYSSEFIDASWAGNPGGSVWVGRIFRWNGQPEVGQQVQAEADGGAVSATTDNDGRFEMSARGALSQLTVVGIDAVPLTRWNRPSGSGVTFEIHLKRPAPPSKGPL